MSAENNEKPKVLLLLMVNGVQIQTLLPREEVPNQYAHEKKLKEWFGDLLEQIR